MARVRLLTTAAVAATMFVLAWGVGLYTCGPVWGRRVEGQVVDKRTGEAIEGAGVFTFYHIPELYSLEIDWHWTTTDTEGRFAIPGHPALFWFGRFGLMAKTDTYPTFILVHPRYGQSIEAFGGDASEFWPGWRSLRFEMEPNSFHLELIREPQKKLNWQSLCLGTMPAGATDHCCEILWGSADVCSESSGRWRN